MGKKVYMLRLYRLHDMDLLSFCATYQFNFVKGLYFVLTAFSKGEVFTIKIPEKRDITIPKYQRKYAKRLTLDEDIDKDAIELLERIAPGYRNSFMKNLMRLYLCYPLSHEFLINESDNDYFTNKFSIFRKGRYSASVARLKKRGTSIAETLSFIFDKKAEFNSAFSEDKQRLKPDSKVKRTKSNEQSRTVTPKPTTSKIPKPDADTGNDDDLTKLFAGLLG